VRIRPLLLAGVVACALTLAPASALAERDRDPQLPTSAKGDSGKRVPPRWLHSSDGVRGEIAEQVPPFLRFQSRAIKSKTWEAVPGVTVTSWDETTPRGPIRAHLMAIALDTPGLAVDYAYAGVVRRTAPLTKILARHQAIGGVNGDFFDIGDTGAPLGLGLDRQEGLLNARSDGWNAAFYVDKTGLPQIGTVPMVARYKQHPLLPITTVNSPEVEPGGIGVYTPAWGYTSGYRITGGQTQDVRMVRILKGRVVETKSRLPAGKPVEGIMLVGRGAGAKELARLRKGTKATVRWWLKDQPKMAITGNKILINDGLVTVVDDREMHPRTAIGIDRELNQLLLLVVDGRQSFSRGYTMVELANRMIDLGADEALNLDGGGSSTMVAKKETGLVSVVNYPSDGGQRSVPNGLEVTYTPPAATTTP
jgi:hypothetical protein